jgi:hypothetical protein
LVAFPFSKTTIQLLLRKNFTVFPIQGEGELK